MSPRPRRRALVVVRHGPAGERGWLALRTALAAGLGGFAVTVLLDGVEAQGYASADLDVRGWLGGDPGADLDGLIDDVGAEVLIRDPGGMRLRRGVRRLEGGDASLFGGADLVIAS